MYGTCQMECSDEATHRAFIPGRSRDPMYVCPDHAGYYEQMGYRVEEI